MAYDKTCILLVEDEKTHAELTIRAIRKAGNSNKIITVEDGEEALDYLFSRNKYEDKNLYPKPGLILLDIKLPGIDGIEVLRKIKTDSSLKRIPVVILSTSERIEDINSAYDCYANSYLTKPVNARDFQEKISRLKVYWMIINKSPDVNGGGF